MKRLAQAGLVILALVGTTALVRHADADGGLSSKAMYVLGQMFNSHGNFALQNEATAPFTCGTADKGALYYDTTSGSAKICNGSSWSAVGGVSATATPQPTATAAPTPVWVTCTHTLSNTSGTAYQYGHITSTAPAGGIVSVILTVTANDGTDVDTATDTTRWAWRNVGGTSTAAQSGNSTSSTGSEGSTTVANSFFDLGSGDLEFNVTPAFTTIVPTTVTLVARITASGGTFACF